MSKLFSSRVNNGALNFSLLILRVTAGALMFLHGWEKLNKFSTLKGSFFDPFHIGSTVSLSLTIFAEAFCAALIVLGLLTRLAAIPLVICMGVVVFMFHAHNPIGQKELAIVYLAVFTTILFTGPGKFSLDKVIGK
jgi:putative oxidoreductase